MTALPRFFSWNQRSRRPELMDQPGLNLAEHVRALRGLARINAISRVEHVLWPPIERLTRSNGPDDPPLRVLDLATGGGDTPIALARRAALEKLNVEIDGCDINPQAVEYAQRQATSRGVRAQFFLLDALRQTIPSNYDVLCCSLFLHHLGETDAIALLKGMASAARRLVLVDDLARSRRGYLLALAGCHVLSGSRVVHVDGPISVAAAFTPAEALALAERRPAGCNHHTSLAAAVSPHLECAMMRPVMDLRDVGEAVWDVIVLGAGPAGTIAAHQLARSGAQTLLVDRRSFPRKKVCGACLNATALEVLSSVGFDTQLRDLGANRLTSLKLQCAGRSTRLPLPGGIALSRERLDQGLVDLAVSSGSVFLPRTEGLLGSIQADARRVTLVHADHLVTTTARARVVLIATGLGQVRFDGEPIFKSHATPRSRIGAGCSVADFPTIYERGTIFMTVGRGGTSGSSGWKRIN